MALYLAQDQLAAQSPKATVWSCDLGSSMESTLVLSKKFAHRGNSRSNSLCVRIPARLGNPEDRR